MNEEFTHEQSIAVIVKYCAKGAERPKEFIRESQIMQVKSSNHFSVSL